MTTIPLWVVPKPHSDKSRLVVDHSAGDYSPNSYISPDDATVHLDTLHLLGKALTRVKYRYSSDIPLVLFKVDVSQAYRRLPMHPLWQLHQVVTIHGSHHVDNNNNFGNHGAGRLWVTFLVSCFGLQSLLSPFPTSSRMLMMHSLGNLLVMSCIIHLSKSLYLPNRPVF